MVAEDFASRLGVEKSAKLDIWSMVKADKFIVDVYVPANHVIVSVEVAFKILASFRPSCGKQFVDLLLVPRPYIPDAVECWTSGVILPQWLTRQRWTLWRLAWLTFV